MNKGKHQREIIIRTISDQINIYEENPIHLYGSKTILAAVKRSYYI